MGITVKELGTKLDAIAREWANETNGRSMYFGISEKTPDVSIKTGTGAKGDVGDMINMMIDQLMNFGKHAGNPTAVTLAFMHQLAVRSAKEIGLDLDEDGDPDAPET